MPTHVVVNIQISGMSDPVTPFLSLSVQQSIAGHHKFELRVPVSVFHRGGNPAIVNDSNQLIGKQITFEFKDSRNNNLLNTFKAVVTEMVFNKYRGAQGDLILRGYSPTILLENGAHFASFNEKTLSDIFSSTLSKFPSNFLGSSKISPTYTDSILYSAQYNESTFNYFKRLANKYGEWFYYDGQDLVLGPPDTSNSIDINFSQNASDLNLALRILPLKFKKNAYDYTQDKQTTSPSSTPASPNLGAFGNNILDEAESVFAFETNFITDSSNSTQAQMDHEVAMLKNQRAANVAVLSGSSDNAQLGIGKVAQVTVMTQGASDEDYGKYIITSIVHRTDGSGNYQNNFTGIPQTAICPPLAEIKDPGTDLETAIVKENSDPDKLGRIKVQFRWQTGNDITPWIRCVMPYVGPNRGVTFVPEIGDEVVVVFSDDDPDNPMVMGSVRNKSAAYSEVDNQTLKKFMSSRYNMIQLNDTSNDFHGIGIRVSEKDSDNGFGKNVASIRMVYESQKGHIDIKAHDRIQLTAPVISLSGSEIYINGTKLVDIKSDKLISETSKEDVKVKGKKIETTADEDITMKSTQTINIEATTDLKEKGLTVAIKADTTLEAEGSVKATLKGGAQLEMSGGAMATLKGGMVMIN